MAVQVTLEPPTAITVAPQATAPVEWQGDLLLLGVTEECFETVGESHCEVQNVLKFNSLAFAQLTKRLANSRVFDGMAGLVVVWNQAKLCLLQMRSL